jgi:Protein of unknown function (DUF1566)
MSETRSQRLILSLLFMGCLIVPAVAMSVTPDQFPSVPVNNNIAKPELGTAPRIGDAMEDGTIYAGISPDTGRSMYATAADAPGVYDFNQAVRYARELDAQGHTDWRLPTKSELNVLFQNREALGGFNYTGLSPEGWYWSSSPFDESAAWAQRFSDGDQYNDMKSALSSLRCVRG